jgi:hypothetical protein
VFQLFQPIGGVAARPSNFCENDLTEIRIDKKRIIFFMADD